MATQALDVVTIFSGLKLFEDEILGNGPTWNGHHSIQDRLVGLYSKHKNVVDLIYGVESCTADDAKVLNEFLTQRGFDPQFTGPLDGVGIASVFDKLLEWLHKGVILPDGITAQNGNSYPGFELGSRSMSVSSILRYPHPVLQILDVNQDSLWIAMADEFLDPMSMVELAFDLSSKKRIRLRLPQYNKAQIPMVSFDVKPNLNFLVGLDTKDLEGQYWFVSQAVQQFKFGMNHLRAYMRIATGMTLERMGPSNDLAFVVDRPFYGWFTQKDVPDVPIGVFYADYDSWKMSEGSPLS